MAYRLKYPLAQTVAYNLASEELKKPEYQELGGQELFHKHQELYTKFYFKLRRKERRELHEMLNEQLKRKKKQPSPLELETQRFDSLIRDIEKNSLQQSLF